MVSVDLDKMATEIPTHTESFSRGLSWWIKEFVLKNLPKALSIV